VLILMRPSRALLAAGLLTITVAIAGTTAMSAMMPSPADSTSSQPGGALGGVVVDRAGSSDSASQLSSQSRIDELRGALETLTARPLGTGLASEGAAADRAGSVAVKAAPDIYLMIVALQTGIPGLVIWLSGLALILLWVARNRRHRSAPIIGAGLAFLSVASMLSHTPDAPPLSLFFWLILLAIAVAVADEQDPEPSLHEALAAA
jgi:O-antigen ligase